MNGGPTLSQQIAHWAKLTRKRRQDEKGSPEQPEQGGAVGSVAAEEAVEETKQSRKRAVRGWEARAEERDEVLQQLVVQYAEEKVAVLRRCCR